MSFFMVQGLPRLPKLEPADWQVRARTVMDELVSSLSFDFMAKYVINSTGRGSDSKTLLKARLGTAEELKLVRNKFSSFSQEEKTPDLQPWPPSPSVTV